MTYKFLSLIAGVSALALAGTVQAAEPMQLSDLQMDSVTAAGKGYHPGRGHGKVHGRVKVYVNDVIVQVVDQELESEVDQANYLNIGDKAKIIRSNIYLTNEAYVDQTAVVKASN